MFKLFRGSYTYLTESMGLEGLKTQLSQFYNKVPHTGHTGGAVTACFVWVCPSEGRWMLSMATVKKAWHTYFPQQTTHDGPVLSVAECVKAWSLQTKPSTLDYHHPHHS